MRNTLSLLVEEIQMAVKLYNPTVNFIEFQQSSEDAEFKSLTDEEKKVVSKYSQVKDEEDDLALRMIHFESSIQLTFYLTLLLFNIYDVPLLNLNYNESTVNVAATKWILGMVRNSGTIGLDLQQTKQKMTLA